MKHLDINLAAAQAALRAQQVVSAHKIEGAIYDGSGNVVAIQGQYQMLDGDPRPDETVYWIKEAFHGPQKLGLQPTIPAGRLMATFQIPGGGKDDVGLIILKGVTPPPQGMRIAIRILKPEEATQEQTDASQPDPEERQQPPAVPQGQAASTPEASPAGWASQYPEAAAILEDDRQRGPGDDRRV